MYDNSDYYIETILSVLYIYTYTATLGVKFMNGKLLKKVIQSLIMLAISIDQFHIASHAHAEDNAYADKFKSDTYSANESKLDAYISQAKEYAEIFLEEWNYLKLAFREEKLEAKKKLSELNFKGDSILDDIMLFRNSDVSRKGMFYYKLLLFDESFEDLDKSVEKYKDIKWFMSKPKLLNQIKKEIMDTMVVDNKLVLYGFSNIDDLSKYPMEFFAWLKVGLIFNELSVQCRSFNIGIYREDPDSPWQQELKYDN